MTGRHLLSDPATCPTCTTPERHTDHDHQPDSETDWRADAERLGVDPDVYVAGCARAAATRTTT